MVLSLATKSMDIMQIEESPKPEVSLKRKRLPSENRRRKVKKDEADSDDFIFETESTVALFALKQSPDAYITSIVNPLLRPGHDTYLYQWLYHMGLLKHIKICTVPNCIGTPMKLKVSRRGKDKAAWESANGDCKHRLSIRTGSFFATLKCDLSQAIAVIKEWCSNTPMAETCHKYDISEAVVKRIYVQCVEVAELFVSRFTCDWLLGGEGSVVLVDVWPGGFPSSQEEVSSPSRKRSEKVRILWLADTNFLPVRYWAQVLPSLPSAKGLKGEAKRIDQLVRHEEFVSIVAELAQNHIAQGSLVLVNEQTLPDVCGALGESSSFDAVTPLNSILKADSDGYQSTKSILENIWSEAVQLCNTLKSMSRTSASGTLSQFLWRQQFATSHSEAFIHMLEHIATLYKPPVEMAGESKRFADVGEVLNELNSGSSDFD